MKLQFSTNNYQQSKYVNGMRGRKDYSMVKEVIKMGLTESDTDSINNASAQIIVLEARIQKLIEAAEAQKAVLAGKITQIEVALNQQIAELNTKTAAARATINTIAANQKD